MSGIIDLTLSYNARIERYSWTVARELRKDGWNARNLQIYSHAGTHMDAPIHFGANYITIDQLPLERLMTSCWVIRIRDCAPKKQIKVEDLGEIKNKFQPGESLLFSTGWSQHVGTDKYRNQLPEISDELADWMVENKVNLIAVEPPSVADVNNLEQVTKIHIKLFEGDIIIVEGITNTEAIKKDKVQLIALPIKIEGGDGAPARVIVIEE